MTLNHSAIVLPLYWDQNVSVNFAVWISSNNYQFRSCAHTSQTHNDRYTCSCYLGFSLLNQEEDEGGHKEAVAEDSEGAHNETIVVLISIINLTRVRKEYYG